MGQEETMGRERCSALLSFLYLKTKQDTVSFCEHGQTSWHTPSAMSESENVHNLFEEQFLPTSNC